MRALAFALLSLALSGCLSSRGGLPATLQLEADGRIIAGYDGGTMAVLHDGSGSARVVESESGLPLYPPLTWSGDPELVLVTPDRRTHRLKVEQTAEGTLRVLVPSELSRYVAVLPYRPWVEIQETP